MDFGWKKKAERLRMTILSAGHQSATELPSELARILDMFRHTHKTKDGSALQAEFGNGVPQGPASSSERMLWEPIDHHGWNMMAAMYLQSGQLWWLLHAARRTEQTPSEKDITFLDKILDHLGADSTRDMIIGPRSSPEGEPALAFGWWTWFNRMDLYEVQVKGQGSKTVIRTVPLGSPESDGYVRVDLSKGPPP